MKILNFLFICFFSIVSICYARDVSVSGYTRKDGTYVAPYHRSSPDSTVTNNYGYKGNTNPYTGEEGHNYYRSNPTSAYYGTSSQSSSQASTYNYGYPSSSRNDNSDSAQSTTYSNPYIYHSQQQSQSDDSQNSQSGSYFTLSNPNSDSDSGDSEE